MRKLLALFVFSVSVFSDTTTQIPIQKKKWELVPELSVISPQTIRLTHHQYETHYNEFLAGLPCLHIGAQKKISEMPFQDGSLEILTLFKAGYIYKTSPFTLGEQLGDTSLHWVPISGGLTARYKISSFPYLRPALTVGGGFHWINQRGSFENFNTSYWIPYLYFSPTLSFFEGEEPSDWFGGFHFSMSYQDTLTSKQIIRAWSFDLSIAIIL